MSKKAIAFMVCVCVVSLSGYAYGIWQQKKKVVTVQELQRVQIDQLEQIRRELQEIRRALERD